MIVLIFTFCLIAILLAVFGIIAGLSILEKYLDKQ